MKDKVSPADDMYFGDNANVHDHYFKTGLELATYVANKISSSHLSKLDEIQLLELPCGYGRVTRHLIDIIKNAKVTACDVQNDSVIFQRDYFKSNAVLIKEPLCVYNELNDNFFDLAIMGSLVTHLNEEDILSVIKSVHDKLKKNGLFIITIHGSRSYDMLNDVGDIYKVGLDGLKVLLDNYGNGMPGFSNYLSDQMFEKETVNNIGDSYGISLTPPSWIEKIFISNGFKKYDYIKDLFLAQKYPDEILSSFDQI